MKNKKKYITIINKSIKYAKENHFNLKFPKRNIDKLHFIGYAYASFSNNSDYSDILSC